jgi:type II secretory pathway component GspD/PulD (secretin)
MLLEDESYTVNKLPLLGDIPYLGYIFQHQVKTKKTTNLIIEVTPYIMIDGEVVLDEEENFEE